jgi:hypothetical protein
MDAGRFDAVTRNLAIGTSRRRALGLVLGGVFAAGIASTAKAQNRRRRRGRRGDGEAEPVDETLVPPGTLAGGIWEETIEVCSFDTETGEYKIVAISPTEVPDHLGSGGTIYLDCCVDTDCPPRVCLTASGCIEGACAYDNTEGAPCVAGDGTSGVCGDDGTCVSTGVAPAPIAAG